MKKIDLIQLDSLMKESLYFSEKLKAPHGELIRGQKNGVIWMMNLEGFDRKSWKLPTGGILGHKPGCGKTLTTITCCLLMREIHLKQKNSQKTCILGPTLVIVPANLIEHWKQQILLFTTLQENQILCYSTLTKRQRESLKISEVLQSKIFILASYQFVANEFKRHLKRKETDYHSFFFSHKWYRVVLDEAQMIKSSHSLWSKSVKQIQRTKCWGLTGTPWNRDVKNWASICQFLYGPAPKNFSKKDVSRFSSWSFWQQASSKDWKEFREIYYHVEKNPIPHKTTSVIVKVGFLSESEKKNYNNHRESLHTIYNSLQNEKFDTRKRKSELELVKKTLMKYFHCD